MILMKRTNNYLYKMGAKQTINKIPMRERQHTHTHARVHTHTHKPEQEQQPN